MSMTTTTKSRAIEAVTAALIATLIVGAPNSLSAQQNAKPTSSTDTSQTSKQAGEQAEEEVVVPSKDPGHEGIHVSGHWVIDVHDKEGKLVEHRDFHNSLYSNGAGILLRLLSGTAVAEKFAIRLNSNVNTVYVIAVPGSYITTATANVCNNAPYYACSLTGSQTMLLTPNTGQPNALQITGQLTADKALIFSHVDTNYTMCHNGPADYNANSANQSPISTSPVDCAAGSYTLPIQPGGGLVTGTDITPLSLTTGQVLTVTVTISFS